MKKKLGSLAVAFVIHFGHIELMTFDIDIISNIKLEKNNDTLKRHNNETAAIYSQATFDKKLQNEMLGYYFF